jgi:hypothetical protein
MLSRLAKLAKHLNADYATAASMAHTDGKPDPRRPLTYTITGNNLRRPNTNHATPPQLTPSAPAQRPSAGHRAGA